MEFILLTEVDNERNPVIDSLGVLHQDYYDTIGDAIYYLSRSVRDNSEITIKKHSDSFSTITVVSPDGKTTQYEMAKRQTLSRNKD